MSKMVLGVDFDNTIVSYDQLFFRVAVEKGLVTGEFKESKTAVRDFLRRVGKEQEWTEMQGYVYGARMMEALPFPGALECLARLAAFGIKILVISHKTRTPYLGPDYDLHGAAWQWLEENGFFDRARIGLNREDISFELTKQAKLERISRLGCTHFIDDLPEFLSDPSFPASVSRILFDPNHRLTDQDGILRVTSWPEIEQLLAPSRRDCV